jgi:predicted amino acid-binding ACT domain protein
MGETVRRVEYFYFWIDDRPGQGAAVLGKLKDARVNVLSFTAFPGGAGQSQLTLVPESPDAFPAAAKAAGLHPSGRRECFLVQGEDHVGAAHDVLRRLAEHGINCVASNGCVASGGTFGMVLFVKPPDMTAAARALGL